MNRYARRFASPLVTAPACYVGTSRRSFIVSATVMALSAVSGCATVNQGTSQRLKPASNPKTSIMHNGRDVATMTLLQAHHTIRAMIKDADRASSEPERRDAWAMVSAVDVAMRPRFGTLALEGEPDVYRSNWAQWRYDFEDAGIPFDQIAEFEAYVFA